MNDIPSDDLFADEAQSYAQRAHDIALQNRQSVIDVAHVFLALVDNPGKALQRVFQSLSMDTERLKSEALLLVKSQRRDFFLLGREGKMFVTPLVKQSLYAAIELSKELKQQQVSSVHIFWGVVSATANKDNIHSELQFKMNQILSSHHITPEAVLNALPEINNPSTES